MKISHAAKGTQENSETAGVNVFYLQLCKLKSGTSAHTQRKSVPAIPVQL